MNEMLLWVTALLLSAVQFILLVYFLKGNLRPFAGWPGLRVLLPAWALAALLYRYGISLVEIPYLTLTLQLVLFTLTVHLIRPGRFRESLYLGLAFLLVIVSVKSVFGLLGQKWLGIDYMYAGTALQRTAAMAVFALFALVLVYILRRTFLFREPLQVNRQLVILSFAAVIPYLYVYDLTLWLPLQREQVPSSIAVLQFATCALALFIMATVERREQDANDRRQSERLQHVMESQHLKYRHELEQAELINRKYHDMKNMLLYLQDNAGDEVRPQIQKLIQDIHPYECSILTGTRAMDILLTHKLDLCAERQITCTPYVDGHLLDFLPPLDVCTIFGNALDNAIEGCMTLDYPAERFISIKTAREKGFVVLNFRNSCEMREMPGFGEPQTTKEDVESHGYGLPNMRQAAERSGGQMLWRLQDGEFLLTFLFPAGETPDE